MHVIGALNALSDVISTFVKNGKTIGFVPTMGALHAGHLSLIRESVDHNDVTIVSIFVNPLQFNNASDLAKYPRVLEEDINLLQNNNVDVVFTPSEDELYPEKPIVSIDFGALATTLEGEYRKGHFEGVGLVISKFLHVVRPTRAYFGFKDLQQFILIRRMCIDLGFQCEIVGVETVRESSGLALSSRNKCLSKSGRDDAAIIYEGLTFLKNSIARGEFLKSLLERAKILYDQKENFELEYLEAVNPVDLSHVDNYDSLDELAICVAGYVEGVRLIDNLYLRLK